MGSSHSLPEITEKDFYHDGIIEISMDRIGNNALGSKLFFDFKPKNFEDVPPELLVLYKTLHGWYTIVPSRCGVTVFFENSTVSGELVYMYPLGRWILKFFELNAEGNKKLLRLQSGKLASKKEPFPRVLI